MTQLRMLIVGIVATVAAIASGCSEPVEYIPVEGTVYYRDKPLSTGVVMFQPVSGPPSRGDIQADGTFQLTTPGRGDGARTGPNTVRISSRQTASANDTEIALGPSLIPQRYSDFASSGLTAEVKPSGNDPFVFKIND